MTVVLSPEIGKAHYNALLYFLSEMLHIPSNEYTGRGTPRDT